MLRNFRVDLLSFIIGFVAATLFWWVISRVRPLLPDLSARFRKFILTIRQRNLEGADEFIRNDTIRRAQRQHIAASLFSLDEIILTPKLLSPPIPVDPDIQPGQVAIASQTIPYLPDWPELAAGQGALSFSIADALQKGASIAVIGQPGAGKTVALADFACRLARKGTGLGKINGFLPIYFHILDISTSLPENRDPLPALIKAITPRVAVIYQPQLSSMLTNSLLEDTAVLILDGFDELDPETLPGAVDYLKAFREKYPGVSIVIAASPYAQDGLTDLGLIPLGLTAWGPAQRNQFVEGWSANWARLIAPEVSRQDGLADISPILIDNWLKGERGFPTPLEWTLKVWGAYAGDLQPGALGPLETLANRLVYGASTRSSLDKLAREFLVRQRSALPYLDLDKFLTNLSPTAPPLNAAQASEIEEEQAQVGQPNKKETNKGGRDIILSTGEQILEMLVKSGILAEHPGSLIRFTCPAFAGYLAAPYLTQEDLTRLLEHPYWAFNLAGLHYTAAQGRDAAWIETFLKNDETPLQMALLAAARWLGDSPAAAPWRAAIFRALLNGLQDESLPLTLRARMATAFVCSNDPSAPKLFKQLLSSHMAAVRQLTVLATGAWGDPALVGDLLGLLVDPEQNIRNAACLALVALHTDTALSAVADMLMNGDEILRQAAAESLVHLPGQGVDIINEASKVTDLLTRRAAVFGLLQIREPWSKERLEKIAVEDAQWVVRNAAAQALEAMQEIDPRIPRPLPKPHNSSWLIAFSGKRGVGLSAYQPATEALLMALKSGTEEDQMMALRFLKEFPEEKVANEVYALFFGEQPDLRDAALLTVWHWFLGGKKLPLSYASRV